MHVVVRRMRRRSVSVVALVSLLALTALLAACGGSSSSGSTSSTSSTSTSSSSSSGGSSAAAAPATATATPIVDVQTKGALAPYLVGPNGHTLYVFAHDSANHSACSGTCVTNWPPLILSSDQEASAVPAAKGTLDVIDRPGSGRQLTYNGWPLYYFKSDAAPGDTKGNGVAGLWKVATPDLAAAPESAPAAAATATGTASSQ